MIFSTRTEQFIFLQRKRQKKKKILWPHKVFETTVQDPISNSGYKNTMIYKALYFIMHFQKSFFFDFLYDNQTNTQPEENDKQ